MSPIQPAPEDSPDDFVDDFANFDQDQIAVVSDSESPSDEENGGHEGYELLSQDPENSLNNLDDDEDDSNDATNENSTNSGLQMIDHQSLLLPPLLDSPEQCAENDDVHMDDDHIETIKNVMRGITLPTSNLPPWAQVVPEEEWKSQLISRMSSRKLRN